MKSRSCVGAQNGRENLLKAAPKGLDNGILPLRGGAAAAREKKGLSKRLAPFSVSVRHPSLHPSPPKISAASV